MAKSNTEEARVEVILNGQKANATLNEMRAGARALAAELGKIPEPLNNADYSAGKKKLDDLKGKIGEVTGKADETGFSFKRLGEVAGGMGLANLVEKGLGVAKKVFTDAMSSTETMADKMEKAFTQVDWGYKSLLRTLVEGGSAWRTVFQDMDNAIRKAAEYFDIKDELEKRQRSWDMTDAERQNQIFDLRRKQKDVTLPLLEQAKAGLDILHLENEGLMVQDRLKRSALDAALLRAEVETKLDKATILAYEKNLEKNLALVRAAEAYNTLLENQISLKQQIGATDNPDENARLVAQLQAVETQINNTSTTIKVYAGIVKQMGNATKETLDEVKTSYSDMWLAAVNMKQGSLKAFTAFNQALKQLTDGNKKENDKYAAEYNKHAEYLKKITQDLAQAQVQAIADEHERELKMAEVEFNRKTAEITGHSKVENQLREALQAAYLTQVAEINKKYNDKDIQDTLDLEKKKWDAKIKGLKSGSSSWFNASIEMLQALREAELANTTLTEQQKLEIEERYRQLRKNLNPDKPPEGKIDLTDDSDLRDELQAKKLFLERTGQDTIAAQRSLLAEQRDLDLAAATDNAAAQGVIWEQYYADLKSMNSEWADKLLQAAQAIVGMLDQVNQAWSNYENAQLQKDQDANDAKKANLKKRLDSGQISQKQYDDQILKMDTDMDAKKRKLTHDQAVRQKETSIFNATISMLEAIIKASTAGPILGQVLAALTAIADGIIIAELISTPVPEAAKGKYDVIGQDDGRSYSADWGGQAKTGIYSQPTLVAEAGPELIVDAATTKNLQMNFPWILGAINNARVPQFSGGNYPDMSSHGSAGLPYIMYPTDPELKEAIIKLNGHLDRGINSRIHYDYIMDEFRKVDQIKFNVQRSDNATI
jgi:hypothetical protein